jgi:hypothetical protein
MKNLNIINEEIKNFLNESAVVNSEDFSFKTVINMFDQRSGKVRLFFDNYENFSNDYDVDITNAVITVNWKVGFWTNDFGIENFFVNVDSLEGAYMLEMRDKHTDEVVQETQKNINDVQWKFETDEAMIMTNGNLYAKDLMFDFKTNMCTLGFFQQKK